MMATSASHTTANIGLSQWAETDFVLREDFNSDNAAIDGAVASLEQDLAALSDTVDTKADQTALQAHASDGEAHGPLFELKADATALEAEAETRTANDYYVKLFDITTTAGASQVDLDFSEIDATEYACVDIIAGVVNSLSGFTVLVNNETGTSYQCSGVTVGATTQTTVQGNTDYLLKALGVGTQGTGHPLHADIRLILLRSRIQGFLRGVALGFYNSYVGTAPSTCAPADLSSVNLVGSFAAGTQIQVYGLRK